MNSFSTITDNAELNWLSWIRKEIATIRSEKEEDFLFLLISSIRMNQVGFTEAALVLPQVPAGNSWFICLTPQEKEFLGGKLILSLNRRTSNLRKNPRLETPINWWGLMLGSILIRYSLTFY